ncbi:MAG: SMC-Scp complex subunit ScpB [Candidatus Sungbacteria bacterium]|uniref:SMC-Scp complex subunit ScpB n=1 Tax=Candidatus Sungiibacteriota bacterium TaxID=2750080 RepID=A0A931WP72_9BACT|nr:SMC-Scp complex subunit ScpB [Candidatus Sungbacteria bacterium]
MLKSKIEAILFMSGEPVGAARFAKILGVKIGAVESALEELKSDYAGRGIRLIRHNDAWQLGTAPEASDAIESLVKSEFSDELSKAALEVLSIIAYKGPLTRTEIEYIRGVNSSFILRSLLLRGLIERMENPKDARSYLYRVSVDFIKHLGLENIGELPEWESFHKAPVPAPEDEKSIEADAANHNKNPAA